MHKLVVKNMYYYSELQHYKKL